MQIAQAPLGLEGRKAAAPHGRSDAGAGGEPPPPPILLPPPLPPPSSPPPPIPPPQEETGALSAEGDGPAPGRSLADHLLLLAAWRGRMGAGKGGEGTAGGGGKRRRWGCPPPPARGS